MGLVRWGPPTKLMCELKDIYGIRRFVETGTCLGDTAYWASQNFDKVLTIERSEVLYKKSATKYSHIRNIDFQYGDSRDRLREIVQETDQATVSGLMRTGWGEEKRMGTMTSVHSSVS